LTLPVQVPLTLSLPAHRSKSLAGASPPESQIHRSPLTPSALSQGTLLRASQFLAAELPIRLAHRVKELDELPHGLHKMPSIEKVKRWYAQSFEVRSRQRYIEVVLR
jgi:hypothetical protein